MFENQRGYANLGMGGMNSEHALNAMVNSVPVTESVSQKHARVMDHIASLHDRLLALSGMIDGSGVPAGGVNTAQTPTLVEILHDLPGRHIDVLGGCQILIDEIEKKLGLR